MPIQPLHTRTKKWLTALIGASMVFTAVSPVLHPIEHVSAKSVQKKAKKKQYLKPYSKKGIVHLTVPKLKSGQSAYVVLAKGKKDYSFKVRKSQNIPLPFGNGVYSVTLYSGNGKSYKEMESKTVRTSFSTLTASKQRTILSPGNSDKEVQKLMKTKFKDWKKWSQSKRVANVHAYVTKTYSYDYDLLDNLPEWFLPDMSRIAKKKKGICYDMASITSSLLREMNVPTRIVMGYPTTVDGYHSWNEVYINKKWRTIDTTTDLKTKVKSPYKSAKAYKKVTYRF